MTTRPYRSQLREQQAEQTRERIVEALLEQVVDTQRSDFSIAEVAARAGVSERTVYRHFPSREDLLGAIDEHYQRLPQPRGPESLADFPAHVDALYAWFDEHAEHVEAAHVAGIGRELHLHARARRGREVRETIDRMLAPLPARERRIVYAVVRCMFGSAIWRAMREEVGLSSEEAREAARWVAQLITKDVSRRLRAARKGAKG